MRVFLIMTFLVLFAGGCVSEQPKEPVLTLPSPEASVQGPIVLTGEIFSPSTTLYLVREGDRVTGHYSDPSSAGPVSGGVSPIGLWTLSFTHMSGYGVATATGVWGENGFFRGSVELDSGGKRSVEAKRLSDPRAAWIASRTIANGGLNREGSSCDYRMHHPVVLVGNGVTETAAIRMNEAIRSRVFREHATSTDEEIASRYLRECEASLEELRGLLDEGEDSFFQRTLYKHASFDVVLNEHGWLTFGFFEEEDLGGAHPLHVQSAVVFDLERGERMTLDRLVRRDAWREFLIRKNDSLKKVAQELMLSEAVAMADQDMKTLKTMSEADAEKELRVLTNFFLTRDGLEIFYNEYEIAPYAAGLILNVMPWNAVEDVFDPSVVSRLKKDT